jgi:hypothetical protein
MTTLRSAILAFLAAAVLAGCDSERVIKPLDRYPGPWKQLDSSVLQTMQRSVGSSQNCRAALMRPSSKTDGEYLVYCTRFIPRKPDPTRHWDAYLVSPARDKVVGPNKLFEDIPPPDESWWL